MDQSDPKEDLADLFIRVARNAYLEGKPLEFDFNQIILIARDATLRAKFQKLCAAGQDPDLDSCIREYLQDILDKLEAHLDQAENVVGLIDIAVIPVAIAGIGAGLAALFAIGVTAGSIFLLGGSILGLGLAGLARFRVKSGASQRKADEKYVKRLFKSLPNLDS